MLRDQEDCKLVNGFGNKEITGDLTAKTFTMLVGAKDREDPRKNKKTGLESVYSNCSHSLRSFVITGIKEMGQ